MFRSVLLRAESVPPYVQYFPDGFWKVQLVRLPGCLRRVDNNPVMETVKEVARVRRPVCLFP